RGATRLRGVLGGRQGRAAHAAAAPRARLRGSARRPRGRAAPHTLGSHLARRFPLHLISNQPATRLHSQYDNGSYSQDSKVRGREPIRLHPEDARARGISDGDVVRVFNDRGACLAGAVLDPNLRRSVVQLSTGAWWDPVSPGDPSALDRHGNPNVLTLDKGTSRLAQGPVAQTALVELERYEGPLPAVEAYAPPELLAHLP